MSLTESSHADDHSVSDDILVELRLIKMQLQRGGKRFERMEREVFGEGDEPGHGERLRTIERDFGRAIGFVKWIGSGGLVGLGGAIVLLYKISVALTAQ